MRGRYKSDGKTQQKIEVRDDELSNAITTVQKDSLVVETEDESYFEKKYKEFYEKNGYIPKYFAPYNCAEIKAYAPTLTCKGNTDFGHCGTVLITEIKQ